MLSSSLVFKQLGEQGSPSGADLSHITPYGAQYPPQTGSIYTEWPSFHGNHSLHTARLASIGGADRTVLTQDRHPNMLPQQQRMDVLESRCRMYKKCSHVFEWMGHLLLLTLYLNRLGELMSLWVNPEVNCIRQFIRRHKQRCKQELQGGWAESRKFIPLSGDMMSAWAACRHFRELQHTAQDGPNTKQPLRSSLRTK